MEHSEHPTQLAVQEESSKAAKAKTGAAADYFKRYEKGREGQEGADEADMQYWLSEDEEESHQLKRQQWKSRRGKEPYVVRGAKGPKLRPAEDVLKRLRWDPDFNVADFTIGYLERFEGVKEMPMTMWISDISEEEFIPQHRIKYFKRNSDGEIVWDREGRVDRIFGSGLTGKSVDEGETHGGGQKQSDES